MNIDELRKQVTREPDENELHWQAIVGALLAAALMCSFATLFVDQAVWLPVAAILFLVLGLLGARSLERRTLRG